MSGVSDLLVLDRGEAKRMVDSSAGPDRLVAVCVHDAGCDDLRAEDIIMSVTRGEGRSQRL
jgi:hypothetical protein